jgi:Flp pilus assembly protein TadG
MALVSPVLFMFLFGLIEAGRALWVQNALAYSASEAARCASNDTSVCGSTTQTQNFAASRSGYTFGSGVFTASLQSCGNQVSATYPMTLSIPYVPVSVTLTAQACYPS